jgi:hypothetical protein
MSPLFTIMEIYEEDTKENAPYLKTSQYYQCIDVSFDEITFTLHK